MIGILKDIGIELMTATVSSVRVPVAERMKTLYPEKRIKRLAKSTGFEKLSIAPPTRGG